MNHPSSNTGNAVASLSGQENAMSEYPKRCTMEEAIECVKAGGKAQFRGLAEVYFTKIRRTKSGKVFHSFRNTANRRYSDDFHDGWIYQITKPAPVADQSTTRTYTTAEAVVEVLRSGEEMVCNRAGTSFTLRLDFGGDIVCDYDSDSSAYIPVNGIKWTKKHVAPKTVTKSFDFDLEHEGCLTIGSVLMDAARDMKSKITVECTIKERV